MKKNITTHRYLDQEEYGKLKQMLDLGLTRKQVMEISGRSDGTVRTIQKSTSLEDYLKLRATYRKDHNKELDPKDLTHKVLPVAPKPDDVRIEQWARMVVALERQADALERLADAWERPSSNLKQFMEVS